MAIESLVVNFERRETEREDSFRERDKRRKFLNGALSENTYSKATHCFARYISRVVYLLSLINESSETSHRDLSRPRQFFHRSRVRVSRRKRRKRVINWPVEYFCGDRPHPLISTLGRSNRARSWRFSPRVSIRRGERESEGEKKGTSSVRLSVLCPKNTFSGAPTLRNRHVCGSHPAYKYNN